MLSSLSRRFEFLTGKRALVSVDSFAVPGMSGAQRLKQDCGLSFLPKGRRIEVKVTWEGYQRYEEVDISRLPAR